MSASLVKEWLAREGLEVEAYLRQCFKGRHIPCELVTAMEYSLLAGGKRLRPVLCLTCARLFGQDAQSVLPFASALEMIHTYSLIHDDLPAMDNDDMRRGKPSSHKKFGEAAAILAGDGLLTEAVYFMAAAGENLSAERVMRALALVAQAAGAAGMVGGQMLDMLYTGRGRVGLEELQSMHNLKTGALLQVSCHSGAVLAGAAEEDQERIKAYGREVGVAFQIVDDILDVVGDEGQMGKPVGSDEERGKVTYPSLLGLEQSRLLAANHVARAKDSLQPYTGEAADFLRSLADYILNRAQ